MAFEATPAHGNGNKQLKYDRQTCAGWRTRDSGRARPLAGGSRSVAPDHRSAWDVPTLRTTARGHLLYHQHLNGRAEDRTALRADLTNLLAAAKTGRFDR